GGERHQKRAAPAAGPVGGAGQRLLAGLPEPPLRCGVRLSDHRRPGQASSGIPSVLSHSAASSASVPSSRNASTASSTHGVSTDSLSSTNPSWATSPEAGSVPITEVSGKYTVEADTAWLTSITTASICPLLSACIAIPASS